MSALAKYNFTSSDGTTANFAVGTTVEVGGATYEYFKSGGVIAQYSACTVSNAGVAVVGTTTTSGAKPTKVCIPQFAIAATDEYFWAPVGPFGPTAWDGSTYIKVLAAALCADSVKLYTTATDGVVDDSATDLIAGLVLTETLVGAGAAKCIAVQRLVTNCQD
jgi:hypothetical protein